MLGPGLPISVATKSCPMTFPSPWERPQGLGVMSDRKKMQPGWAAREGLCGVRGAGPAPDTHGPPWEAAELGGARDAGSSLCLKEMDCGELALEAVSIQKP